MTGSPASGDDEFGLILPGITDHQVLMSLLLRRIGAEDVLGLPPFEREPAVKAFRVWATQLARTINKGKD